MNLKLPSFTKKNILTGSVILAVILILGGFGFLYLKYTGAQAETAHLRELAKAGTTEEVEKLVNLVGKLMELPAGENPTVATIKDKEKLTDQPFFSRAENGDRVLIYAQAKKAILYRPSTNKIVEVSVINIGGQNQLVSTPSATPKL